MERKPKISEKTENFSNISFPCSKIKEIKEMQI